MVTFTAERFSPKRLSPRRIKAKIEPQLHWKVPMEKGVYKVRFDVSFAFIHSVNVLPRLLGC